MLKPGTAVVVHALAQAQRTLRASLDAYCAAQAVFNCLDCSFEIGHDGLPGAGYQNHSTIIVPSREKVPRSRFLINLILKQDLYNFDRLIKFNSQECRKKECLLCVMSSVVNNLYQSQRHPDARS